MGIRGGEMRYTRVFLYVLLCVSTSWGQTIRDDFFNMTTSQREPFPNTYVNGLRLWTTGTSWAQINTAPGVYDFSHLDNWLALASQYHSEVLYTFGRVPLWASSDTSMKCNSRVPDGECAPPDDLNADGTGTDQHWKEFVTALVTHAVNSPNAQIRHWEMWNEPDTLGNWQGTMAQMLRMTKDGVAIIKALDPGAVINSPAPTGEWGIANGKPAASVWMGQFLAAGGGKYIDTIDFHAYVWQENQSPVAEDVVPLIENLKSVVASYGYGKLEIWATEGSWGTSEDGENGISNADLQAAFVGRYLLLLRSEGLSRFYWFDWDSPYGGDGTLWTPEQEDSCTSPSASGGYLCQTGIAYNEVSSWMRGSSFASKCSAQTGTTIWSCTLTRSGGFQGEVIWDTAETCSGGTCATKEVEVGTEYLHYVELGGATKTISNNTVPVGAKPILLENQ
jgi:hypothetical protein